MEAKANGHTCELGEAEKNWNWLLGLGIVFIILGVVGLGMSFYLTIASIMFFGVFFMIGGIAQIFQSLQCKGWQCILPHALIGVVYLVAGLVIVNRPHIAAATFTMILAWALMFSGIFRMAQAVEMRAIRGWSWAFVSGLISMILGMMIIARWPTSGLWVIGLFIAIEMIVHGWTLTFTALAIKKIRSSLSLQEPAAAAA